MKRNALLVGLLAFTLAVTGCAQAAPAADPQKLHPDQTSSPVSSPSPEAPRPLEPSVAFHEYQGTPDDLQLFAHQYVLQLMTSRYALSGKWAENGMNPSDLATLFEYSYTEDLKSALRQADSVDELADRVMWPVFALGTVGDDLIASENCITEVTDGQCSFVWKNGNGMEMIPGGMKTDTVAYPAPGRITFEALGWVPARIAEGNSEAYIEVVLQVDLTVVENPDGTGMEQPFLIDKVQNSVTKAEGHPMADQPELIYHDPFQSMK